MADYYFSACHECKESVMWGKATKEQYEEWHKGFHKGHLTELGSEYDDNFYDKVYKYKDLGIRG